MVDLTSGHRGYPARTISSHGHHLHRGSTISKEEDAELLIPTDTRASAATKQQPLFARSMSMPMSPIQRERTLSISQHHSPMILEEEEGIDEVVVLENEGETEKLLRGEVAGLGVVDDEGHGQVKDQPFPGVSWSHSGGR